jgi:bifunctional glutamyl/prolyl-tRNA synthetase
MAHLKKGDTIQILRKGYYICDSPYDAANKQPCRLLNIPDGGTKEKPTSLKATDTTATTAKAAGDKSKSSTTSVTASDKSKSSATTVVASPEIDRLTEQIVQQGEKVRELKANKSTSKVNEIWITKNKKTRFSFE